MSAGFVVAEEPLAVASGALSPPFEQAAAITRTTDAAATRTRTRRFIGVPPASERLGASDIALPTRCATVFRRPVDCQPLTIRVRFDDDACRPRCCAFGSHLRPEIQKGELHMRRSALFGISF